MDDREKVDSYSEESMLEDKDILGEELWDAGILLLRSSLESTKIR
jgi:hypothetical protein